MRTNDGGFGRAVQLARPRVGGSFYSWKYRGYEISVTLICQHALRVFHRNRLDTRCDDGQNRVVACARRV